MDKAQRTILARQIRELISQYNDAPATATTGLQIRSPESAAEIFRPLMADLERETFWVMAVNTKNRVIAVEQVYVGTLNSMTIRMAELFRTAIATNAAAIIVAHNHPSGDVHPSPEDVRTTRSIIEAGQLLDIPMLDHLIIGPTDHYSIKRLIDR